MQSKYTLILIEPGGAQTRDLTYLTKSIQWSGDQRQPARELRAEVVVPRDGSLEPPNLAIGCALRLVDGSGNPIFTGQVVTCSTSTTSSVVSLGALDGGRFLSGNQGWYSFSNTTPEKAAAQIAGDFGIPLGALAPTGVTIARKFPGVWLSDMILTLYTMAGEQSGKRYLIRFDGEGRLHVVEKATQASLEIVQTSVVTNKWDLQSLCNRVEIRSDTGGLLQVVEDTPSQAVNGRLQRVLTQKTVDKSGEAQSILEDARPKQTLTVQVLDPPLDLITGETVQLKDTGSGVSGLFWVDSDTHSWKTGIHTAKLSLNVRNVMDSTSAGGDL